MPEDNTIQPRFWIPVSQHVLFANAVGVSHVHSSDDHMPNVDTPGLLVDTVGAHTMAPPNDRIPDTGVSGIQNNSVDNNLHTHVGSSLRLSLP
nr:hypothetical protein [Tanacetum cinerariifolium]